MRLSQDYSVSGLYFIGNSYIDRILCGNQEVFEEFSLFQSAFNLDLSISVYFYLKEDTVTDWETPSYNNRSAKEADVTWDGLVNHIQVSGESELFQSPRKRKWHENRASLD